MMMYADVQWTTMHTQALRILIAHNQMSQVSSADRHDQLFWKPNLGSN